MPSKKLGRTTWTLKVRLCMMMAALMLLANCQADLPVTINDYEFCSPPPPFNMGAACDNFLTANARFLSEEQWMQWQNDLVTAGKAVECTSSDNIANIKAEIEKLCSVANCDYPTLQKILKGLSKIEVLGKLK